MNIFKSILGSIGYVKASEVKPTPTLTEQVNTIIKLKEEDTKKHLRPYLDDNLYNFALEMQKMIKENKVASSDYTTQDLEKLNDDIATINAQYEESAEFSGFDVKAATRLFLLNNQLK